MSPKQWLALLCFFVSYLFFGASVFYHIEQGRELERRGQQRQQRYELHELIVAGTHENATVVEAIYAKVNDLCGDDVHINAPAKRYHWTFYHSFFFSFIVCSTIGYGNISPSTPFGKMFMILYALIGIPVNGFLFAGLGDYFSRTFTRIYQRYKVYKMATKKDYMPMRFTLIGRILLYLMPGLVFFIIIPSCMFSYFEDWPYTTSIYYSFVTLTTIGFGDYVATFNAFENHGFGVWYTFYEIFVIFWFIFGLGYLVMILSFIAKGMRSKRITRLEHQLSGNIKATQHRIWQGVTKDVGYLRRILNELYMMKFKPVYTDDCDNLPSALPRSASCPDDLWLYRSTASDTPLAPRRRRRAVSVPYAADTAAVAGCDTRPPAGTGSMLRIQSDSDLHRIDRARTFQRTDDQQAFGAEHILAQVVSALGNMRPADDPDDSHLSVLNMAMDGYGGGGGISAASSAGGVHGFSDADILASEYVSSAWTLNQLSQASGSYAQRRPKHRRARAASVFSVPTRTVDPEPEPFGNGGGAEANAHEWTWSGNNAAQVQEFLRRNKRLQKQQQQQQPRKQSLFRDIFIKNTGHGGSFGSNVGSGGGSIGSVSIAMPSAHQSVTSLPDAQANGGLPQAANAGQPSMFTKLNPFRRRLLAQPGHRHSITGLDEITPSQYLERSTRGRGSRASQPFGPKQYLQATAHGRKSAFSVMTTAEPAHDAVLETTTIADLIRALEVVHTTVQREQQLAAAAVNASPDSPRRKMGLASLTPPKMSPTSALRSAAASGGRRGSLRPMPAYTTIFNSKQLPGRPNRRMSHHFTAEAEAVPGGVTAAAELPPPPYDAGPKRSPNRRFSVRPTNLAMAPGQVFQIPSVQAQSAVQRRLSLKPSPLARGSTSQSSGRFLRGGQQQQQSLPAQSQQQQSGVSGGAAGRNVMWRPTLVETGRTRHGSLSELHEERNERKRSDSK